MLNHHIGSKAFLVLAAFSCAVQCQFLPQSHLGRLVQSFTSPLVLSGQDSDSDSYSNPSSQDPSSGYYNQESAPTRSNQQHQQHQQYQQGGQQMMQQAPSQQRGIPQQYYGNDEDGAPSNNKEAQEYKMGAYLGPTIDDKEINGVFNSNDDRDDDDGPNSYDGSNANRNKAASNLYGHSGDSYDSSYAAGGAPNANYGRASNRPSNNYNSDQEDAADEDESNQAELDGRRGRRGQRNGLSQAASHFQQQRGGHGGRQHQMAPMMAAANGYAPFGYAGPVDLSNLMAGLTGNAQVYNGDGSEPNANYYAAQQAAAQRGGRSQSGYQNNQNQPEEADNYQAGQARNGAQKGKLEHDDDDADED